MSSAKTKGKGKGKGADVAGPEETDGTRAAAARIALWVARARVGGAVGGFLLGLWLCRRAGFDWPDAALRGLLAGAALCLVAWLSTLLVIQALIRTAEVRRREEIEAAGAQAAAALAERYANEDQEIQRRIRRRRGEPDPDEAGDEAADVPAEAMP